MNLDFSKCINAFLHLKVCYDFYFIWFFATPCSFLATAVNAQIVRYSRNIPVFSRNKWRIFFKKSAHHLAITNIAHTLSFVHNFAAAPKSMLQQLFQRTYTHVYKQNSINWDMCGCKNLHFTCAMTSASTSIRCMPHIHIYKRVCVYAQHLRMHYSGVSFRYCAQLSFYLCPLHCSCWH